MELKPCPFCGQEGQLHSAHRATWADCSNCFAKEGRVFDYGEKAEAIAAWNRRADPAAPLAEALRAIMARMESARAQIWRTPGIADQYIAGGLEEARDALAQRETQHAGE